jgi:hypothetical protein
MTMIKVGNPPELEERAFLQLLSVWQGWSALEEGDLMMIMMIMMMITMMMMIM